jgi:hypothetical protein
MAKIKPLTKEMIVAAQKKTLSNRSAAQFLRVSYTHYKKWAKIYTDEATGKSLFDKHLNRFAKGIPKNNSSGKSKLFPLDKVLNGEITYPNMSPQTIKKRLVTEGFMEEACCRCRFNERRVLDYRVPLLLNFKDFNKTNYKLENLELLCYNCFFLVIGDIFTSSEAKRVEGVPQTHNINEETVSWDLDDWQAEKLRELDLGQWGPKEDPNDTYISFIK